MIKRWHTLKHGIAWLRKAIGCSVASGILMCSFSAVAADAEKQPAELEVSGYGWLGNLRLERTLRILNGGKERPEIFTASHIEDAALLLISRVREDGFLRPRITARLSLEDGRELEFVWRESIEEPLPRPLRVKRAEFHVREGVFYHLDEIQFDGLTALSENAARAYFIEMTGLFTLKRNRTYSPERFERSLSNLADELQRRGFQTASVRLETEQRDPRTGAVRVRIRVEQGPRYIVRSVREEVLEDGASEARTIRIRHPNQPYSRFWEQDYAQRVRTNYYHRGYPDAVVEMRILERVEQGNELHLSLAALAKPGSRIRVGDVNFIGNERTVESVVERRIQLEEGDWLNRIAAERGRQRLLQLGVFDAVTLRYEDAGEDIRDLIYELDEGERFDVSLLFGYGSYELLRAGVQLEQHNVFGRAHHQRLRLTQSFRSTGADYVYTMPEFFGEDVDVFFDASGLRREEVSFTRLEYGGGAGVRKLFRRIHTDVSVRYNYQFLRASQPESDFAQAGVQNSRAAAIIFDANHDRRDNPLYPTRGHKLLANLELAAEYLGGNVNYQRLELAGSWHLPINAAQLVHLGLSHGLISTIGSRREDLPFNRRFFPGGENSIRGYPEGEASPRNSEGKFVGTETYFLGNIEFEQSLTPKWSLVFFADGLAFARDFADYPAEEFLVSAGGGLRWKTFIGPVRLEYGHNLNPRRGDPAGTVHFSLGFPF